MVIFWWKLEILIFTLLISSSQKNVLINSSTKLANKGDIENASAGQGFTRGQSSIVMMDTYVNQSVIDIRPNDKSVARLKY